MTRDRRLEVLDSVKDIQEVQNYLSITDCFFVLYDNKEITGAELDYLMDWMTL